MNAAKTNHISLSFDAISENEAFARMTAAMFMAQLNPTLDDVEDVKTAVSEAVTNAIIHGYEEKEGMVEIHCVLLDRLLHIEIKDNGKGIPDVEKAKQPFYTTKPECERSGMGFAFMEAFMDSVKVESELHIGTRITMEKEIGKVEDE